jgi:hypothetical protein
VPGVSAVLGAGVSAVLTVAFGVSLGIASADGVVRVRGAVPAFGCADPAGRRFARPTGAGSPPLPSGGSGAAERADVAVLPESFVIVSPCRCGARRPRPGAGV